MGGNRKLAPVLKEGHIPQKHQALIGQLTPSRLAEITGGTWVTAPPDDWRPRGGACFHIAGPHCLVFTGGPLLSDTDPSRAGSLKNCALVVNEDFQDSRPLPQLRVGSVFDAAKAVAADIRERYSGKVCAVTGSVGKSSTCKLLRHALRRFGSCAGNDSYGNILRGVIRTTANLGDETFAVFEAAGPVNIAKSSRLVRPHVALLTGLAPAHLERANTLDELAARKAGIFAGLEPGGTAVVNRGIPLYETVFAFARKHAQTVVTYGDRDEADVRLLNYDLERQHVRASVHGEIIEYPLALLGKHMAINSLAALAALHALGLDWQRAAFEFGYAEPPRGRSEHHRLKIAGKSVLLIDDAYNANPASMIAGLELLAQTQVQRGGKRIAVLGDMLELGDDEARFHAELAGPVVKSGIDRVHTAGLLMTHLWGALPAHLRGCKTNNAEALVPILQAEAGDGDVILFKGSHGSKLYKAANAFRQLNESLASSVNRGGLAGRAKRVMQRLLKRARKTVWPRGKTYTLTFCGDTSLGDYFLKRYRRFFDWKEQEFAVRRRLREAPLSFFAGVRPLISGSDCLIANLETTLPHGIRSPHRGRKMHVVWDNPKRTAAVLKAAGVDALNLANNHANDFGAGGLLQTLEVLKASGFSAFGAGPTQRAAARPFTRMVRRAGRTKKLIVIGAYEFRRGYKEMDYYAGPNSPGVNPLTRRVARRIGRLRAEDPQALIVACPHWLQNYHWANAKEIGIASSLIDAGADLVIGTGAHMIGQCQWSEAGTVILSIGDFIFNWPGYYRTYAVPPFSLIARLDIAPAAGGWSSTLKLYPIVTDNARTGFQVQPVDHAMLASAYALLAERAPDEAAFRQQFEADEDARGLHLALTRPVSPRFV